MEKSGSLPNVAHLTLISNSSEKPPEKTARIIMVGDSGVGKSCIIMQYVQGFFKEKGPCTAGVELSMKPMAIDGEDLKVQIWDTAGQERYRTVTKSFFKQAMGAFLVFDLTSRMSFQGLADWFTLLEENAPADISVTVLGNKNDMKERGVSDEEIGEFLHNKKIVYFETSAKTGKNLDEAFLDLVRRIKRKRLDNKSDEGERKSMRLMSQSLEPGSPDLRLKEEEKKQACC